jgi:hypothetical protein
MKRAKVTFHGGIQDSQDFGSDDEYVVSRVFFTLEIDGVRHRYLHVNLRQAAGSDPATSPIEVNRHCGYAGPFNAQAFREAVEQYYRGVCGRGDFAALTDSPSAARRPNHSFLDPGAAEFEVSETEDGW